MSLTLGLDLGIGSVGWGITDDGVIVDCGVRKFSAPEKPKDRTSNRSIYSSKRSEKRTLSRKKNRLKKAKLALEENGFIPTTTSRKELGKILPNNVWEIRVKGLDQKLDDIELSAVLYYLCNHRGFKPTEGAVGQDDGKIKKASSENIALMKKFGARTMAEAIYLRATSKSEKSEKMRNGDKNYTNSIPRNYIINEIEIIVDKQIELNPEDEGRLVKIASIFKGLIIEQKHFTNSSLIKRQRGNCTHYPQCVRAAKNSPIAELFKATQKINDIRINGRKLTDEERNKLYNWFYEKKSLNVKQMLNLLNLSEEAVCNLDHGDPLDKLTTSIFTTSGYHALKSVLYSKKDSAWWEKYGKELSKLTQIAEALTLNYEKDETHRALKKTKVLNDAQIEGLMTLDFSGYARLSNEVMKRLTAEMQKTGESYSETVKRLDINKPKHAVEKLEFLPKFDKSITTSQTVFRSLCQARRVINDVIKKYGTLAAINIELGKEIKKSKKALKAHKDRQKAYEKRNAAVRQILAELKNVQPDDIKSKEIMKYKLWEDQKELCTYTGEKILLDEILFGDNSVQVDHILPYSRSYDDSYDNKVLCKTHANQAKKNMTPFEWYSTMPDSDVQFHEFEVRTKSVMNLSKFKIVKLHNKHYEGISGFLSRHLNQTREMEVRLREHIETYLKFDSTVRQPVKVYSGHITATLRNAWGIFKNRDENDLHHAEDAVILALATPSHMQKISKYYKSKEMGRPEGKGKDNYFAMLPWPTFRDDLEAAKSVINISRAKLNSKGGRAHEDKIRPLHEVCHLSGLEFDSQYVAVRNGYAEKEGFVKFEAYKNSGKLVFSGQAPHHRLGNARSYFYKGRGTELAIAPDGKEHILTFEKGDYVEILMRDLNKICGYVKALSLKEQVRITYECIKTGNVVVQQSIGSAIGIEKYSVTVLGEILK